MHFCCVSVYSLHTIWFWFKSFFSLVEGHLLIIHSLTSSYNSFISHTSSKLIYVLHFPLKYSLPFDLHVVSLLFLSIYLSTRECWKVIALPKNKFFLNVNSDIWSFGQIICGGGKLHLLQKNKIRTIMLGSRTGFNLNTIY